MSRLHNKLVLVGGMALLLSLAFSWNARRELQSVQREVITVTKVNESLRKTLGDMTVAITAKDREIDRLLQSACDVPGKARPGVPIRPGREKVSKAGAIHAGNDQPIATAEGAAK